MVGTIRASVPAGKRLDEQLQLIYERTRRNGSMGVKSLNFVAQHFNISYESVHRVCKKYHQAAMLDPSFALTFPQFTQIMREALGKTAGGDLDRTSDQARELARTFTIYDATGTTPGRLRTARAKLPRMQAKEVENSTWGPQDDDRGRTPLDTGLVTPRRLKTASFLPTTLNMTWAGRNTSRIHGESHIMFSNTPRNLSSRGSASQDWGGKTDWHSEYMDLGKFYSGDVDFKSAGEYVPFAKFPVHKKFETEANEIGRASRRLKTGQLHEPPVRHPAEPRGQFPHTLPRRVLSVPPLFLRSS
jgi:hypothetical protein